MDTIGQPMDEVIEQLKQAGIPYMVSSTQPSRTKFQLQDIYYVIRQQVDPLGTCNLIVAAKMGKEVF